MKKIPFRTYTILAASAWLIVVSLLNVFAEKTDVSWNENRTLQEMPSTSRQLSSLETLMSSLRNGSATTL